MNLPSPPHRNARRHQHQNPAHMIHSINLPSNPPQIPEPRPFDFFLSKGWGTSTPNWPRKRRLPHRRWLTPPASTPYRKHSTKRIAA